MRSTASFLLLASLGLTLLTACGGPISGDSPGAAVTSTSTATASTAAATLSSSSVSSLDKDGLSVWPATAEISASAGLLIGVANGKAPYTFSIVSGNGSVTSVSATVANFSPNSSTGNTVVEVKDAAGSIATVTIIAQ